MEFTNLNFSYLLKIAKNFISYNISDKKRQWQ